MGYDPNSFLADPLDSIFIAWSSGNYHLREGCQAIDTGTDQVLPIVQYDLEGVPRPQGPNFDIGSYEYLITGIEDNTELAWAPFKQNVCRHHDNFVFQNVYSGQTITIYDAMGRKIHSSGVIGNKGYEWHIGTVPNGIYFYCIQSRYGRFIGRGKLIVIR